MRFEKGEKIKEYTLEESIGGGASGEVWKARGDNKLVAIKFMNENLMRGPNAQKHRERMQREIDALKSLNHPNIPRLYESDLDFSPPYLVMEYIGAESYDKLIQTGEILKVPLKRRLEVIEALAYALHTAHVNGIIHRDIKPGNIAGVDTPRLLDFSVAIETTDISSTQSAIGTEAYMDPDPESVPDILGDIYSFSVVCFQILFGRHPIFTDLDMEERRRFSTSLGWSRLVKGEWQQPSLLLKAGKLPPEFADANLDRLDAVFTKGLGSRAQRYTDPTVFAKELTSAIIPAAKMESLWHKPIIPNVQNSVQPSTSIPVSQSQQDDPLETTVDIIAPASKVQQPRTIVAPPEALSFSTFTSKIQNHWNTLVEKAQLWWKTSLLPRGAKWQKQFMALPQNTRIGLSAGAGILGLLLIFILVNIATSQPSNGLLATSSTIAMTAVSTVPPTDNPSVSIAENDCSKEQLQAKIELAKKGVNSNDEWTPYWCNFKGIDMVLVPSGSFEFASRPNIKGMRSLAGQPVTMKNPFWLARFETSNAQFNKAMYINSQDNSNLPKERITWKDALQFCINNGMTLPSEVEWEYAARGPSNLLYPWGNLVPLQDVWDQYGGYANYCDILCKQQLNSATDPSFINIDPGIMPFLKRKVLGEYRDGFISSAPVNQFDVGKSWVGAYNMAGNVSEWTSTILRANDVSYPYDPNQNEDTREDTGQGGVPRVIRGGSYIALLADPSSDLPSPINEPQLLESITTIWRQSSYQEIVQGGTFRIGVRCAMNVS